MYTRLENQRPEPNFIFETRNTQPYKQVPIFLHHHLAKSESSQENNHTKWCMYHGIWSASFLLWMLVQAVGGSEKSKNKKSQLLPRIIGLCVQKSMCNVPCYDNGLQAHEGCQQQRKKKWIISSEEETFKCINREHCEIFAHEIMSIALNKHICAPKGRCPLEIKIRLCKLTDMCTGECCFTGKGTD